MGDYKTSIDIQVKNTNELIQIFEIIGMEINDIDIEIKWIEINEIITNYR